MRKTTAIVGILVLVALSVLAVQHYRATAGSHMDMPEPEAASFWEYINTVNPYTDWDFFPGYEGMYPGKSPHGAYLKLYANETACSAAEEGKPMPPGAILVKENYGKDKKTLAAITPMYKVKGYNPEAGDWFWAKYTGGGKAAASGKVSSCIECHKHAEREDMVFSEPR